jgi:eukaryotic-like serine/threonine-protein kinase
MVMVFVPAGSFIMGNDEGQINERPKHEVSLDAFWIDQTEVTNAMFQHFVEETGYETSAEDRGSAWAFDGKGWSEIPGADWQHPQGPNSTLSGLGGHPVVNVSWFDAKAYCEWAGARLPSEAEWEKAARGTDGSTYPWGEDAPTGSLLNFGDFSLYPDSVDPSLNDGYRFTAPVGSFPSGASPYGALDMAGNVWEWVNDWFQEYYYSDAPADNPLGPKYGDGRVFRGGSWNHSSLDIRSSIRMWSKPYDAVDNVGFRCSLTQP